MKDKEILEKCVKDGFCEYWQEGEGGHLLLTEIEEAVDRFCALFPEALPGETMIFMDLFTPKDKSYWSSSNNQERLFSSFEKNYNRRIPLYELFREILKVYDIGSAAGIREYENGNDPKEELMCYCVDKAQDLIEFLKRKYPKELLNKVNETIKWD